MILDAFPKFLFLFGFLLEFFFTPPLYFILYGVFPLMIAFSLLGVDLLESLISGRVFNF